jgi:hypothetical protein
MARRNRNKGRPATAAVEHDQNLAQPGVETEAQEAQETEQGAETETVAAEGEGAALAQEPQNPVPAETELNVEEVGQPAGEPATETQPEPEATEAADEGEPVPEWVQVEAVSESLPEPAPVAGVPAPAAEPERLFEGEGEGEAAQGEPQPEPQPEAEKEPEPETNGNGGPVPHTLTFGATAHEAFTIAQMVARQSNLPVMLASSAKVDEPPMQIMPPAAPQSALTPRTNDTISMTAARAKFVPGAQPTAIQAKIIELCLRPGGATADDLYAHSGTRARTGMPWKDHFVMAAVRFGYPWHIEMGSDRKAHYCMGARDEAAVAAAVAAVTAPVAAAPVAPVAPKPAPNQFAAEQD